MSARGKSVARVLASMLALLVFISMVPAQTTRARVSQIAHIPGYTVQETIGVPIDGQSAVSATILESNVTYKLRASGTATVGGPGLGDAEYAFDTTFSQIIDACVSPTLDFGIAVNDATMSATKQPRWGNFRSDHVYTIDFTGTGDTITVNYHDCNYNDNSGYFVVDILRPTNDTVLESVQVPSDGSTNTSVHALEVGSLYQLRAYGLLSMNPSFGLGDAEYGPEHAAQDACTPPFPATDIGIGLNDSVADGDKLPYWGPFSQSHVYTILIAGTGTPISLNFHDCHYDDNSGALGVEIIKLATHPIYLPLLAR
jgi:hypothetical protein